MAEWSSCFSFDSSLYSTNLNGLRIYISRLPGCLAPLGAQYENGTFGYYNVRAFLGQVSRR